MCHAFSRLICLVALTWYRCVQITFKEIPEDTINTLIQEGDVYWCAGGLMVEHPLVAPHVVKMEGGLDSVMGLKKESVIEVLQRIRSA